MTPAELTVVVPAVNGWADLERCLAALEPERDEVALEVLVVDRCGEALRAAVAGRFPWAQVVPVAPATTIPQMRAEAFDRATAPSVAVIEDHVLVPRGWARRLLAARRSARVVGGGVRNAATARWVDRVAFYCEYSHLLVALPAGPSAWLTGNNTVYDRALLAAHRDVYHAGRWEDHLHAALRRAGVELVLCPDLVVDHRKHYTVVEYLSQRYLYARSFAGARLAGASRARRALYGLAALGLPAVLLGRVGRRMAEAGRWRELPAALPLLALFVAAWGAGEAVGSWFGAGRSLERVR